MERITMPIVLRIDVDNAYGWDTFIHKAFNYMVENYFFPCLYKLGCGYPLKKLVNYLEEVGVKTSVFFKYTTIPIYKFIKEDLSKHEIGLHILSANNLMSFLNELNEIKLISGREINGVTKHGNGVLKTSRRHAWRYEPEKYLQWVYASGLKYFSGNIKNPMLPCEIRYKDIYYFPGIFYVEPWHREDGLAVDDIIDNAESGALIIILVHPFNWYFNINVKYVLSKIIDNVDKIYNFKEVLSLAKDYCIYKNTSRNK